MNAAERTQKIRGLLVEVIDDADAINRLKVKLDPDTRTMTIVYRDLDDDRFREAYELVVGGHKGPVEVTWSIFVGPE